MADSNLKSYISKINDRNLQRKRESGFTTYVLYSLLLLILYKISDLYPKIPFRSNFTEVIFIISCSFIIFFHLEFLYIVLSDREFGFSSVRLIKKSNNYTNIVDIILLYSSAIIPFISIIITLFIIGTNDRYSLVFIISNFLFFGSFSIVTIKNIYKNIRSNQPFKIMGGIGKPFYEKSNIIFWAAGISAFIIIYGIISIYNAPIINQKLNIIVFSFLLSGIPYILSKLIELNENDNYNSDLENLEYEINILDLKDDQIKLRLQQYYMGFFLTEWINSNTKDLDTFSIYTKYKFEKFESLILKLLGLDKGEFKYQFIGMRKEFIKEIDDLSDEVEFFFTEKLRIIDEISKNSKLSEEEKEHIKFYYEKLVSTRDEIGKSLEIINKSCPT